MRDGTMPCFEDGNRMINTLAAYIIFALDYNDYKGNEDEINHQLIAMYYGLT